MKFIAVGDCSVYRKIFLERETIVEVHSIEVINGIKKYLELDRDVKYVLNRKKYLVFTITYLYSVS